MAGEGVVGNACKAYYNSATHTTPTWVEMKDVMDLSLNLDKVKADVSTRGGWKRYRGGQKDVSIDFGYLHREGADVILDLFLDSWLNGSPIEFAFMDQAIAAGDARGLIIYCEVFAMPQTQDLDEGSKYDVSVAPTRVVDGTGAVIDPEFQGMAP